MYIKALIALALGATLTFGESFNVPTYERHFTIAAGAVALGPNAPTDTTVGTSFRGLGVNANNETLFFQFHIPVAWDGVSDMALVLHWTNQPGTAIGAGETVIWDCDYQSIAEGGDMDAVAATNTSTTYTQSGAGTDGEQIETVLLLDFDDATNPLVVGDTAGFSCFRDFTADTYGTTEDAIFLLFGVRYNSTTIGSD